MADADFIQQAEIDRELMRQLQAGNRLALEALYKRHARLVHSLIARILGDRAESEGVLEEVYFELWRSADRFDESCGTVQSCLMTLARSRSIDRLHSRGKRVADRPAADSRSEGTSPDGSGDLAGQADSREQVRKALAELDPETRELIERSFYGGRSHREIADALNKPSESVKTQLCRGLQVLAKALHTNRVGV